MTDLVFDLVRASAAYAGEPVLHDVDLAVAEGECVAVMGRSGAGKSTLLGLLHAARPLDIALVPQAAALVRPLSVFHNVYMGRLDRRSTAHNLRTLVAPARADVAEVGAVLDEVGLGDKMFAKAATLSGGQQQRTSLARALYNGRPILLADEPVSALDRIQGAQALTVLRRRHHTLVLAMHDVDLALEFAQRIVVLEDGRKVIDAPSAELTASDLQRRIGGQS